VIAAVEAGGTSFVVAICHVTSTAASLPTTAKDFPKIVLRREVDSSHDDPQKTLEECAQFLKEHRPAQGYHALGIASFGPLGVHNDDPTTYGKILNSSPKAQWRNVDLLTPLREACQGSLPLQIKVDTDVNAPAMAEHLLESTTTGISSLAYITVGTGIGVGLVVNHKPVHGRMHPEGGHVPVQPLEGDTFGGYSWGQTSPFFGKNTVEGLACSVALTERYQQRQQQPVNNNSKDETVSRSILASLPEDDNVWDHAANALANLCATLLLTLSIEKIVLGGGLMNRTGLLAKIQQRTLVLINHYLELPPIESLITESQFGNDAGLMGTVVLALTALLEEIPMTSICHCSWNRTNIFWLEATVSHPLFQKTP